MLAQQTAMDTIANNLSNADTTGFKRGRTAFQDLLYRTLSPQEAARQGSRVGLGTAVSAVQTEWDEGAIQDTGNPLDLAIEGNGFLAVTRADGSKAYTRAGDLSTDAKGQLVTNDGDLVTPKVTVPQGATDLTIGADGAVTATVAGKHQTLGTIELTSFSNPAGLTPVGSNLYTVSPNSGAPVTARAGSPNMGTLRQGALESSNVNAVDEMVGMITTQRAYEGVSKVVSAADEMLGEANQLRHG
jgi:flagellar basal-body rod protein FlgG